MKKRGRNIWPKTYRSKWARAISNAACGGWFTVHRKSYSVLLVAAKRMGVSLQVERTAVPFIDVWRIADTTTTEGEKK